MRRLDDTPLDPEVAASLDAIDATVAGEPVDPRHAELAELALLLVGERPRPASSFTTTLDDALGRRFAAAPTGASAAPPRRRWWLWTPAAGMAVAATVAAIVVLSGGSGRPQSFAVPSIASAPGSTASSGAVAAPAAKSTAPASPQRGAPVQPSQPLSSASGQAGSSSSQAASPAPAAGALVAPPPNGRKIIQGAQLSLSAAPSRIEAVAQEVFVVVGQARGIVNSSTVTATGGPGGYAEFQLSLPSSSLPQAMAALSSLRYARVASRTDSTQDVNNQYQTDVRNLADARALRTSLLTQLANATTQPQIDSLTARIHDAEASISSDQAALRSLNGQIDYSQVTVTINGGPLPVPLPSTGAGGGGFSLGQAAHDAGRVLTVAAGVALIAGAALVPLTLAVALGWWALATVRRRRREQALDLV
jgi:hypothetical protein